MYVVSGTRLTYQADFDGWSFNGEGDVGSAIAQAGAYLKNQYNLIVESSSHNISLAGFGSGTVTLGLRTDIDRGTTSDGLTDIRENVDQAFSSQNSPVTSSRILSYTPPNATAVATGAVNAATTDRSGQSANPIATDSLNPFAGLWDKVQAGGVGFALGVVAIIGVGVYLAVRP